MHAIAGIDRVSATARLHASTAVCLALVAALAGLALGAADWQLAVYTLSFWHYYLYLLAYRLGAIPLSVLKRDAVLMKSVALTLCGWLYLQAPLDWPSLLLVLAGFGLNAAGAWALGSDRTYYGYEIAALPPERITRFPFSWISHPMLAGNIVAFSALLLNAEFRQQFWPLAAAHVACNLGLLAMETFVRPLRLAQGKSPSHQHDLHASALSLLAGAATGLWAASRSGVPLAFALGAIIAIGAWALYRCYTAAGSAAAITVSTEDHG